MTTDLPKATMADKALEEANTPEQVSLTLKIDANVYEAFQRKARQASLDVETFLSNTLSIVLGCRAFDERYSRSQETSAEGKC